MWLLTERWQNHSKIHQLSLPWGFWPLVNVEVSRLWRLHHVQHAGGGGVEVVDCRAAGWLWRRAGRSICICLISALLTRWCWWRIGIFILCFCILPLALGTDLCHKQAVRLDGLWVWWLSSPCSVKSSSSHWNTSCMNYPVEVTERRQGAPKC